MDGQLLGWYHHTKLSLRKGNGVVRGLCRPTPSTLDSLNSKLPKFSKSETLHTLNRKPSKPTQNPKALHPLNSKPLNRKAPTPQKNNKCYLELSLTNRAF